MEKKKNDKSKSKSKSDILPLDLIHIILLRVPIRHLARLKCVSKLWCSLISDPNFAESHFHHSSAATNACFFMKNYSMTYLVYVDDNDASQEEVCLPFEKPPSDLAVLGSCRGFILLDRHPHFLVVWNPLTGFSKRISYSHIVPCRKYLNYRFTYSTHLHGFGYDASQDDYIIVAAWRDSVRQEGHLECLSLKTNSWINLDAALPKPLGFYNWCSRGLFLNGAIHWVPSYLKDYRDAILIFDLKERSFARISAPEQTVTSLYFSPGLGLALLGGCLALHYHNYKTEIWVMKEYKVHSSWTLYEIPCSGFRPLSLSSNRNIIGRRYQETGYFIYNVRGDLLKHFKLPFSATETVYSESLLSFPSDIKDKDN